MCHIAGVVFTSLPTPPEDLHVAESYVNELDIFTGQLILRGSCNTVGAPMNASA